MLLVEQNAALALAVADRGYIMQQNGRIVAAFRRDRSAAKPLDLLRETYLGNRQGRPRSPAWRRNKVGLAMTATRDTSAVAFGCTQARPGRRRSGSPGRAP